MSLFNKKVLSSFIPFIILIFTWSFIGGWISLFSRYWLWVTVGASLVVLLAPSFFSSKQFFFLAVYSFVIICNLFLGDQYFSSAVTVLFEILLLVFSSGLCYYLSNQNNENSLRKRLFIIGAFVIVFTSIGTFLADRIYPGIVRDLVVYANNGISCAPYYRMGVCEYNMPHALPILIPPFVMWVRKKNMKLVVKLLCLCVLAFLLLLVYTSGATTPLILSFFALVCSLLANPKRNIKTNIAILVIVTLIALPALNDGVQLRIVHHLKEVLPEDNANQSKLRDFETAIVFGETTGDLGAREDLYSASISTFLDNIFFGSSSGGTGGHSIILDRLGALGLVGTIPYLLFIWLLIRSTIMRIPKTNRFYYLIGTICFIATLATKNIGGIWMWIAQCVFLPVSLLPLND